MAYVRKTDALVTDIQSKTRAMSQTAQARFDTDSVVFSDAQTTHLIEAAHVSAWSDAPELRGKLPKDWSIEHDMANLRIYGPATVSSIDEGVDAWPRMAMSREFTGTFLVPRTSHTRGYRPHIDVAFDTLTTELQAIITEVASNEQKLRAVQAKFGTIETQLRDFMGNHASLNAALKEMPQLEMYVPDEYMSRVRAESAPRSKVERTQILDLGIDVDALAAAAVTHRILTATS